MTFTEKNSIAVMAKAVRERKSAVFIGSHSLFIQQRKHELLQATGGYIGIQWLTLHQLVDRIMQQNGQSYVRIDQSIREDLVETVMLRLEEEGRIPLLKDSLRHAGMVKSVALWIEDLEKRPQENWRSILKRFAIPVLVELGLVYEAYATLVENRSVLYKKSEQLMEIASEYLKEPYSVADLSTDLVIVEGNFPELPGVVLLLESIARLPTEIIFMSVSSLNIPSINNKQFRCLIGKNSYDEIQKVREDFIKRLDEGALADEIAIVSPNEAYLKVAKRELRVKGVQVKEARSISLLDLSLTKRLLGIMELQKNNWQRTHLLICTSLYSKMVGMSDIEVAWGRAIIKESGVATEFSRWLALFRGKGARSRLRNHYLKESGESHRVQASEAYAQKWIRFLFWLRRCQQTLPVDETWENHLNHMLEWIDQDEKLLRKGLRSSKHSLEYDTVRNILRTRREIALSFPGEKKGRLISLDRVMKWLRQRMAFHQIPCDTKGEGVHVLLADQICGAKFDYTYVVGLADGIWPPSYTPHWIWQLVEQDGSVTDVKLPSANEQRQDIDRLFDWAVMSGQREVILSMPMRGERGRPVVPSHYLKERFEEADWQYVQARIDRPKSHNVMKKNSAKTKSTAIPCFFDENVPISVTGIDEYARCPFAYFASRVLTVREEVIRHERLMPTDIGSIMHHVLRLLAGEELKSMHELIQQATILLDEELKRYGRRYCLHGPNWEGQCNSLRNDLESFLWKEGDQLLKREGVVQIAEWGFGKVHLEKMDPRSTGEPLLFKKNKRELRLSGIIDRVELADEGFKVIDYKLSKSPTNREMECGSDLQMALYLLAFEKMGPENGQPLEGRFTVLKDQGIGGQIVFSSKLEFEAFKTKIVEQLFKLREAMASGDVLPRPRSISQCKQCSFQSVCRRDEVKIWRS